MLILQGLHHWCLKIQVGVRWSGSHPSLPCGRLQFSPDLRRYFSLQGPGWQLYLNLLPPTACFFLICLLWQVVLVLIPSVQLGAQIAGRRVQDKHPNRLVANQWIWMTKYNPYKHFFPRKRQCFIGLTETRENRIIWKTTLSSDSQCGAKTPTVAAPDSQVEFLYVQAQTCLAKYF